MIENSLVKSFYHNFVSLVEAIIIVLALKGWISIFDSEMNVLIWLLIGFSIILFFIFPLVLDIRHNIVIASDRPQEGAK